MMCMYTGKQTVYSTKKWY